MTATLYLIRHASPDRTRTDLDYHTLPGPGLTPEGHIEATRIGQFLAPLNLAKVCASPFERAMETAWAIGVILGLRAKSYYALSEWARTDTIDTVKARLLPFLDEMCVRCAERGPIALVTHGWIIRTILEECGMDADELAHYCNQFDTQNPCPCAGVWKVTYDDDGYTCELVYTPEPFVKYEKVAA